MRVPLLALCLCLAATGARALEPNPTLGDLPTGRWVKIHQQQAGDAVTFKRQKHGGSAYDSKRGRLVLFGSNTHSGNDWTNSPLFFDLASLTWSRLYPDDEPASYAVTSDGLPVAGPNGDHPWAMHTFGAVTYDPTADALVVASLPGHMKPGRFNDDLAELWPQVARHPTWILDLESGKWRPLDAKPVHFFPYATTFDSDRGLVLGYRGNGVHELLPDHSGWRRAVKGGKMSWGNNVVYDADERALITFGCHKWCDKVVIYQPATGLHQVMATPGTRPPGAKYPPMAYHPEIKRTVAMVDRQHGKNKKDRVNATAETWLYDLPGDAWQRLETGDLPFGLGMNYNLHYDPLHRLLLLVADPPGEPAAVWALRLEGGE